MTDPSLPAGGAPARPAAAEPRAAASALYRAVWRWHFYAGLLVLPVLALLAVTGAVYLFKDEINAALHADLRRVEPRAEAPLPPSALAAAALEAIPGTLRGYTPPAAPGLSAQVKILRADGLRDVAWVNPWTAEVLGSTWDAGAAGSRAMWVARKLHSLDYVGWWGNRIVEAAAGWTLLLTATGLYLWWPRRGRRVGVLLPRRARGRALWRDLHAVTGAWTALALVFLALTGLPWSGVWGKAFHQGAHALGLGVPDGYWSSYPLSTVPMGEALDEAPWILAPQPMPASPGHARHGGAAAGAPAPAAPAMLDEVVARAEALGLAPGWTLDAPTTAEGVFTASAFPDAVSGQRVVHFDRYTGEALVDMGLEDLGALGRAAEWGISVHMGQEFGRANQLAMLLACLAILLTTVSAAAMWWKRRPAGGLGAPRPPQDWRAPRAILAAAVVAGMLFPLVGLSLVAMLAIDLALPHALRRRLG
ncbi:PepSY-associated TM helix domain-containing protein [Albimonas pacifica]|uniref:Uncharacterized iron-regulated membrane protein n=1 Tax=Albimonas pacifica TaxID=1114924 RepID=A0A1I3EDK4_9RHOB|nr:PepSY domain-containing protein [Albimonas pacifica]SFH97044.1 Uncharacterized iron-regulated membrane protein [Albimonas pacifica]